MTKQEKQKAVKALQDIRDDFKASLKPLKKENARLFKLYEKAFNEPDEDNTAEAAWDVVFNELDRTETMLEHLSDALSCIKGKGEIEY